MTKNLSEGMNQRAQDPDVFWLVIPSSVPHVYNGTANVSDEIFQRYCQEPTPKRVNIPSESCNNQLEEP